MKQRLLPLGSFSLVLAVACAGPAPRAVAPSPSAAAPPPTASSAPPPDAASDWLRRGAHLVELGGKGHPEAYPQAKEALKHCIEEDPKQAECYLLLGEAAEITDDEQGAAQAYNDGVLHDPADAHLYLRLAETYLRFKLYTEAEQVLREGVRRVPGELQNAAGLLHLYRLLAVVAEARGDTKGVLEALETGAREAGSDPELDFELGSAYATARPPRYAEAQASLQRFVKRVCRGRAAADYRSQCEVASALISKLPDSAATPTPPAGSTSVPPPAPKATPSDPVALPPVAVLPVRPLKAGEAYTVWGASYSLRSRSHRHEVVREGSDGVIAVTGYVVKTNLADTPKCAVHAPGRADPEGCSAPIPAFWLGDTKDAPLSDSIRVLGWASNAAQIIGAIRAFDAKKPKPYSDEFWGLELPNPLPAAGAKVTVYGTYGTLFMQASSGMEVEPQMGLLNYRKLETLEPVPELATLPGVRRARVTLPSTAPY